MVRTADYALYAKRFYYLAEQLACMLFAHPMVYIYQAYSAVCILKLVIFAVGGYVCIGSLRYGFVDEFGSGAAA